MTEKQFELVTVKRDPLYNSILRAIDIIKDFIIRKKLIVYGGTAIDYALRLRGDSIYSDEANAIPDLDFYSPDYIADAYELALLLFNSGYEEARTIMAIHVETMRVDIKDNHFLADMSHCPREVFDRIPTVNYGGMNVVHPHYQFIDLHRSLSRPFINYPQEVIFARWSKDIARYNKLLLAYPVDFDNSVNTVNSVNTTSSTNSTDINSPKDGKITGGASEFTVRYGNLNTLTEKNRHCTGDFVLTGWAALTLLVKWVAANRQQSLPVDPMTDAFLSAKVDQFAELVELDELKSGDDIAKLEVLVFESPQELFPSPDYVHYNRLHNAIEETYRAKSVVLYKLDREQISSSTIEVDGKKYCIAGIHEILCQLLGKHFLLDEKIALRVYSYIVAFIDLGGPFALNLDMFGDYNENFSRDLARMRLSSERGTGSMIGLPQNFYPIRTTDFPAIGSYYFLNNDGAVIVEGDE